MKKKKKKKQQKKRTVDRVNPQRGKIRIGDDPSQTRYVNEKPLTPIDAQLYEELKRRQAINNKLLIEDPQGNPLWGGISGGGDGGGPSGGSQGGPIGNMPNNFGSGSNPGSSG